MNKLKPIKEVRRLEDLSILELSRKQIDILLEGKVDLGFVLNVAQESNQLRVLLRHMILKSLYTKAGVISNRKEELEWRTKHWQERVNEAFIDSCNDM